MSVRSAPRSRRAWSWLALCAGVVALHALILQWATTGVGPERKGSGVQAILARRIVELPPPAPPPEDEPAARASHQEPPKPHAPPRTPGARTARLAGSAAPETLQPKAVAPDTANAPADTPQPQASVGTKREDGTQPVAPPEGGGTEIPVYATAISPPLSLSYELRRNALVGEGELHWRHDGQRYELTLEGHVFGRPLLEQISEGSFDPAGVAPLRYVDKRRGRELRAINFQREIGKISYSAATHEVPLVAGAQDRLSWIAQLAAILAAEPARRRSGERIAILVAGARGEADVWRFEVLGEEILDLEAGHLGALHLRREAARPYDPQWDVWLGAAQGYWPLRALQTVQPSGDTTEWRLKLAAQTPAR